MDWKQVGFTKRLFSLPQGNCGCVPDWLLFRFYLKQIITDPKGE